MRGPRRGFLLCLTPSFAALSGHSLAATRDEVAPPNIVLILVDGLGYGDLSLFGQKHFRTPHLDRMAGEAIR